MNRVVEVFHQLGYSTELGPQVESDFYNFEALNFPPNHPARDTQDTLQIAGQGAKPSRDRLLMRTHTSPVQIRTMVAQAPPLRIVIPARCTGTTRRMRRTRRFSTRWKGCAWGRTSRFPT